MDKICTLVIHQFEIFDWPIKLNSIFKCWPKDQTFFQLYFFPSGKSRLLCICIACLSVFSTLILQFLGKNDHFLTCYLYLKFNHFGKNWKNVLYIRTLVAACFDNVIFVKILRSTSLVQIFHIHCANNYSIVGRRSTKWKLLKDQRCNGWFVSHS